MGVRTMVGIADGTGPAAFMYDSVTGFAVGPIWEAEDSYEQIEAFQQWMRERRFMGLTEEIGLGSFDLPSPLREVDDVRAWPENGIAKLIKYWRKENLDATGCMKEAVSTDG